MMHKLIAVFFLVTGLSITGIAQDTSMREPVTDPFSLDNDTFDFREMPVKRLPVQRFPREPRDTDSAVYVRLDSALFSKKDPIKDSVLGKYTSDSLLYSVFAKIKKGREGNYNVMILRKNRNHWLTYLLLFILSYFILIRTRYSKNLSVLFDGYLNNRSVSQFIRDESFFKLRSSVLLMLFFVLIFALVLYFFNIYFSWDIVTGFKGYMLFCSLIIVYYSLKFMLMRVVGYIFLCEKMISSHITIISISNIIYSIIALPILITLVYIPSAFAFYLSLLLALAWGINIIIKYLRSLFFVSSNFHFHKFYLFVYLCTLEIAPLLVFMKLIQ